MLTEKTVHQNFRRMRRQEITGGEVSKSGPLPSQSGETSMLPLARL